MGRFALMLSSLVAVAACKSDDAAAPPLPLDARLGPTDVRAGVITRPGEFVGSKGRLGDYKLYNDRVAVTIAAVGSARGFHPYGGVILDADTVHDGPSRSAFGEVVVGLDLSVLAPDTIEVVTAGGTEARIRVTGTERPFPLLDAILGGVISSPKRDVHWTIDYVLKPGATSLAIEHTLFNPGRVPVEVDLPIAAFLFGTGARPFFEGPGFSSSATGVVAPYYGAVGEDVSYIYGRNGADVTVLFGESGIVLSTVGGATALRARDRATFTDRLVIGDGDFAKTRAAWRTATERPAGSTVSGQVIGAPGHAANVHVLLARPPSEGRDYVARTRTDSAGRFSVDLEPGRYVLVAVAQDRLQSAPQSVEVQPAPGAAVAGVSLEIEPTGSVTYRVTDESGPLPSKLTVVASGDPIAAPPRRFGERAHGAGVARTEFVTTAEGEVHLGAGSYNFVFSRGLEYEVVQLPVVVQAGASSAIEATLTRSVDTSGWMTSDSHIHSELSPDSPDSFDFTVRALAAANIELPISTDHEALGDFNPAIEALALQPWLHGIVGTEISSTRYGHFNVFPLVADPLMPGNGRMTTWYTEPPASTLAEARTQGDPFVQVNHPRLAGIGYFDALGFDRDAFTARGQAEFSTDFDGIEVMSGCPSAALDSAAVADWFAFLNRGLRRSATGSPDNHIAGQGTLGYPINFVRVAAEVPSAMQVATVRDAYKRGEIVVSCGPFVQMSSDGVAVGGLVSATGRVTVDARVAAPSWVDVDRVHLIVGGQIVSTASVAPRPGPLDVSVTMTATVAPGDTWLLIWAEGDEPHGVWAQRNSSFAFTNPIYIDGDGDGRWH